MPNNYERVVPFDKQIRHGTKVLKQFLEYNPPEKAQLDSFNYFINHSLHSILEGETLETSTFVLRIDKLNIGAPTHEVTSLTLSAAASTASLLQLCSNEQQSTTSQPVSQHCSRIPATPKECVANQTSYTSSLDVTVSYYLKSNPHIKHTFETCLGRLPIMVGSDLCPLKDVPNTMKCDFIVKGAKKVVCMEERIAFNKIFSLRGKKDFKFYTYVEFKSMTNMLRSSLIDIGAKKVKGKYIIYVYCPELTLRELIPIEVFLTLFMGDYEITMGVRKIIGCSPLEYQAKIAEIICDNFGITVTPGMTRDSLQEFIFKTNLKLTTSKDITTVLRDKFLIHSPDMPVPRKGEFVLFLLKILLHGLVGLIPPDDRDHYGNKRVYTINHFFTSELYHTFHKKFKKKFVTAFEKCPTVDELTLRRHFEKNVEITNSIRNCLSSNAWHGKTQKTCQYVSQHFDPPNQFHYFDLIRKINTPVKSDSNKIIGPRDLHLTQSEILCPYGTPDGKKVGLIKSPSVQCIVSTDSSLHTASLCRTLISCIDPNFGQFANTLYNTINSVVVLVNGCWLGCVVPQLVQPVLNQLKKLKTTMCLFDVSVYYDSNINTILVLSDAGRLMYPVVERKIDESLTRFVDHLANGSIVLYDKNEIESMIISQDDLFTASNSTHYPHDFVSALSLGYSGGVIPFSNHNQAPRNIYQSGMSKQAIGFLEFDDTPPTFNVLCYPQIPVVSTVVQTIPSVYEYPTGINAVVAIMPFGGENQEDSIVLNKASIDRGMFMSNRNIVYRHTLENNELLYKPTTKDLVEGDLYIWTKLDDTGVVKRGVTVKKNDVLISVKKCKSTDHNKPEPVLVFSLNDDMQVVDTETTMTEKGDQLIKITLTETLTPQVGDKFCLTGDHDVLTSVGWIPIAQVTYKHSVCCLDQTTHTITYQQPTAIAEYPLVNERLYNVESEHVCLQTTLNHKMYVHTRATEKYKLISASACLFKRFKYLKNSEGLAAPLWRNNDNMMAHYMTLFGIWFTKGTIDPITKWIGFNIDTIQVRTELLSLIEQFNIVHERHTTTVAIYDPWLESWLAPINVHRVLPDWVFFMDKQLTRAFVHGLMLGKQEALSIDDMQQLALHAGWSATRPGDIIKICMNKNTPEVNNSHILQYHDRIVDNFTGSVYGIEVPTSVIYVRRNGKPIWTGNSSRHGQKGTVGMIFSQEDMPFTSDGITPDIVISPLCIPSRMTCGHLLEMACGLDVCLSSANKYCSICVKYKASPNSPRCDTDCYLAATVSNYIYHTSFYQKLIPEHIKGFQSMRMMCGLTGKAMNTLIYSGVIYYQRLKHISKDKLYVRTTGPIQTVTRQPKEGRSVEGGHRFGLQERDCIVSHGCVFTLRDRLFINSDYNKLYVCKCGVIYHGKDPGSYEFYKCKKCQGFNLYQIELPYGSKVLIQMLYAYNIHIRLIPGTKQIGFL